MFALAVIPARCHAGLAARLARAPETVQILQHGFAHLNHARGGEKKIELGPQRPRAAVLEELARGWVRLSGLFGSCALPALVPPWNRIDPDLLVPIDVVVKLLRRFVRLVQLFQLEPVEPDTAASALADVESDIGNPNLFQNAPAGRTSHRFFSRPSVPLSYRSPSDAPILPFLRLSVERAILLVEGGIFFRSKRRLDSGDEVGPASACSRSR